MKFRDLYATLAASLVFYSVTAFGQSDPFSSLSDKPIRDQGVRYTDDSGCQNSKDTQAGKKSSFATNEHFLGECGKLFTMSDFGEAFFNRDKAEFDRIAAMDYSFEGTEEYKKVEEFPKYLRSRPQRYPFNKVGKNFKGAHWSAIELPNCDLSDVRFSGASLLMVDFDGSDFSGADFTDASLCSVNFSNANLSGARFANSKCTLNRGKGSCTFIKDTNPAPSELKGLFSNAVYSKKEDLPCGLSRLSDAELKELGLIKQEAAFDMKNATGKLDSTTSNGTNSKVADDPVKKGAGEAADAFSKSRKSQTSTGIK